MNSTTPLGVRIGEALEHSSFDQTSLAKALGTNSQIVNKWIRQGVMPGGRFLVRLPALLGVSADWLLDGSGSMVPPEPGAEAEAFRQIADIADRVRAGGPRSASPSLMDAELLLGAMTELAKDPALMEVPSGDRHSAAIAAVEKALADGWSAPERERAAWDFYVHVCREGAFYDPTVEWKLTSAGEDLLRQEGDRDTG